MIRQRQTRTNRATILFDGQCAICRSGAAMLARLDAGHRFEFISLDDSRAAQLLPGRSRDEMLREMHVVDTDGSVYSGAEAIRIISIRVPYFWWSIPYLYLPGSLPFWRKIYAAVAERRYRLSARLGCINGACAVHRGN